jgi:glycosyltransferase involved in cell wall biosynthesis
MKIAYFITGLGIGGAEVITLDLAEKARRAGHSVMVVWLAGADQLAAGVDPGIVLHPLAMRKTPGGVVAALRKAARVVREFAPDVVHSNMVHSNIFARLLRLVAPIPVLICSEHTTNVGSRARMVAYRLTDPLSDLNTNVSRGAVDEFLRQRAFGRRTPVEVVHNGIDTSRFRRNRAAGAEVRREFGIGDDEFLWLNVGRLTAAKNQAALLRAFASVGYGKLMIVGDGELRDELRRQIVDTGLSEKVVMAGARGNVADIYNAADCFVMSSVWEGFGIVLAEAMSSELPVIATDAGGCAEVVQNSQWMVPVGDTGALAERMAEVAGMSPDEREVLGATNRRLAARFDLNNVWHTWEQIYETI